MTEETRLRLKMWALCNQFIGNKIKQIVAEIAKRAGEPYVQSFARMQNDVISANHAFA